MRFFALLLLLGCALSNPYIWPQPTLFNKGKVTAVLASRDEFKFVQKTYSSVLASAIYRYSEYIWGKNKDLSRSSKAAPTLSSLTFDIMNQDDSFETLNVEMDESYVLTINTDAEGGATISSNQIWGALRALETFSQLVSSSNVGYNSTDLQIDGLPITIKDQPRFKHRGVLIDTARHYMTKTTIKQTIEAMSFVKMNVLHWHIVDSQSFPFVSTSVPSLSNGGAYCSSCIYNNDDVVEIIEFARERGVRVVVEFDVPGHAAAWGFGDPLLTTTDCPSYTHNINNIPLQPINQHTFDVLELLFGDVLRLFPDTFLHLGGDEVVTGCWKQSPVVAAYLKDKQMTVDQLLAQVIQKTDQLAVAQANNNKKKQFTIVHWNEVFEDETTAKILNTTTHVIQLWTSLDDMVKAVQQGYRVIFSPSDPWYLSCGFLPGCPYHSWQEVYQLEPYSYFKQQGGPTEAQQALMLGGEVTMWAEYTNNENLQQQLWPRGAAAAEKLWAPQEYTTQVDSKGKPIQEVTDRLTWLQCHVFAKRGTKASPIGPGYCPFD